MSSFDLSMVMQLAQEEIDAKNERANYSENSGNNYPLVYPAHNGKLTVKLLFNPKANIVQRKITRHNKVPCLQMYGLDCPVCSAISQVEEAKGKEMGAWNKYGYKVRGMCYAQIIDHDPSYFTGDKDPKKGDIVLLMYPKSVYDDINNLFIDSGANLDKLVASNEGYPVVITRSMKANGFPEYNTSISIGTVKSFDTDEEFDNKIKDIPNLNETICPNLQTEKVLEEAKAMGETIIQEYMSTMIVNPDVHTQGQQPTPQTVAQVQQEQVNAQAQAQVVYQTTTVASEPVQATINTQVPQGSSNSSQDIPDCYGKHEDNGKKCMLCPFEDDCFNKTTNG